jgi:hypothetical protein
MPSALNLLFFAQLPDAARPQPEVDLGPIPMIILAVELVLLVLIVVGFWKIFEKAGQPGWAALIPFYNVYILLKVVNRPGWWILLFLIPIVNLVIAIIVYYELAKSFGHGAGYFLGLFFLPFIFIPLLGFDDSRYRPLAR